MPLKQQTTVKAQLNDAVVSLTDCVNNIVLARTLAIGKKVPVSGVLGIYEKALAHIREEMNRVSDGLSDTE
jgi:hypothetical protein